jgi:hypothetical membrane protein
LLAGGGVIGPITFVGAWAIAGATTSAHYSPVDDAISNLARVGAPTRVAMTVGFVVFGLGLIAFGLALRDALEGPAWLAAVGTGASTIAVAATPLGGWSGDTVHGLFATLGYVTIVALPALAARPIRQSGRSGGATVSLVLAAVSAVSLALSAVGSHHGLWQRVGLTVGDAWIVAIALSLIGGTELSTHELRPACRRAG